MVIAKEILFLDELNNLHDEDKPKLQEGMTIGVIGEITGDYEFTAEKVRPWQGNFPSPRNR